MVLNLGNFNKELFAELLNKAKGDRSINNYALKSGVTAAHISRLLRSLLDTPPMPDTIKKLSDHAHNDVHYNDLMSAAGHFDKDIYVITTGKYHDPLYIGNTSKDRFSQHNIKDETYDSLAEINNIIKELGVEDMGFFDIEKWKNLSPADVDEIRRHFEWVAQKAKERNEDKK
jgi:hypothetical protein